MSLHTVSKELNREEHEQKTVHHCEISPQQWQDKPEVQFQLQTEQATDIDAELQKWITWYSCRDILQKNVLIS